MWAFNHEDVIKTGVSEDPGDTGARSSDHEGAVPSPVRSDEHGQSAGVHEGDGAEVDDKAGGGRHPLDGIVEGRGGVHVDLARGDDDGLVSFSRRDDTVVWQPTTGQGRTLVNGSVVHGSLHGSQQAPFLTVQVRPSTKLAVPDLGARNDGCRPKCPGKR